jgi:hypothetical protein
MRQLGKKAAAVGFLVLVALWVVGIVREWSLPYPQPTGWQLASVASYEELAGGASSNARQVTANNLKQIGLAHTPLPLVLDQPDLEKIQVYEKTAQLVMGTEAFDEDEARLRAILGANQAVAFNERKSGIQPGRRLLLEISVAPEQFDALVAALRQIGQLQSANEQKQDRTGEFRQLHAKRQSLKLYLDSVLKLRTGKQTSLEDALRLEQKIQDIEKELQALAVQMGDFLGKESLYHVSVALTEFQPGSRLDRTYALPQRVAHAFAWAVAWWFALALVAAVLAGTALSIHTLWSR